MVGGWGGLMVLEVMGGAVLVAGSAGIHGFGGMAGAAAKFVEAEVAGDGEEPGGKAGGSLVALSRSVDLDEDVLGEVLGFHGVAEHPGDEIENGLLVAVDELLESGGVALFDAEHQGGIGFEGVGHAVGNLTNTAAGTRVAGIRPHA